MTTLLPNEMYFTVAQVARDYQPISRAEIARRLGYSPSTVGRVVDRLIANRVLLETGQRPVNGAGRPAFLLNFNAEISAVLSVDLRLTQAYAAITDMDGRFLARHTCTLTTGNPETSLGELIAMIAQALESYPGDPAVGMIVVGAPSIVDVQQGLIEWAPSLDWQSVPLRQILHDEFKLEVLVENDVNLAALGEYWKGAGEAVENNLVFVSVGTGIGAGIILNGELYRGATHAAGEVAYFITDVDVLRDNAIQIGNLENRVGYEGLIRMAQLVAQRYPTSLLADHLSKQDHEAHIRDILTLAKEGDQAALVVFNELVDILTVVICNTSVLLDPEIIIIGGPSDWNWGLLVEAIHNRIHSALLRPAHLRSSRLGSDALILGGAYAALRMLCDYPKVSKETVVWREDA